MECGQCGVAMSEGDVFCGACGARKPFEQSNPRRTDTQTNANTGGLGVLNVIGTPQNVLRLVSAGLLLGGVSILLYSRTEGLWLAILLPVFAGLVLPLMQVRTWSERFDRWERGFAARRAKANSKDGKFARFVQRPFYLCILGIWRVSRPIKNTHIRAGVRVVLSLYFLALFSFIMMISAYIVIAIVVLLLAIAFMGWVLSLSGKSSGPITGRRRRDWSGNEVVRYTDATGGVVGETHETVGIFGDPQQEHFDAQGRKTGESKRRTDLMGRETIVHFDREGQRTGISRDDTDVLGHPVTIHYDAAGDKTGESRERKDLLGNDIIERLDDEREGRGGGG